MPLGPGLCFGGPHIHAHKGRRWPWEGGFASSYPPPPHTHTWHSTVHSLYLPCAFALAAGRRVHSTSIDVIEAFILRDEAQGAGRYRDDEVGTREGEVVGDEVEGSYGGESQGPSLGL